MVIFNNNDKAAEELTFHLGRTEAAALVVVVLWKKLECVSQPSGPRALGSTPRRSQAMSLGTAAAAVSWHTARRRELARPAQHVPAHSTTLHTIYEQE